ncbi:uncharacterized protein EAE98_002040 [Botrytis deweyae]|uniref:C2H2-type domain-containing protein n=1 Tax=Botrytis deweyae TaxID=2478750 RepID=A0ABQ7IW27_9HELO|nr:uncharacterized protein EAE98_002040 [Botrytis deweyae]KAF7935820.1 hypothetical protein EAE98_002040 [Botrytis deweyae]
MNEDNTKNHQRSILEQAPATQLMLEPYKYFTMQELLESLDIKLAFLETMNSLNDLMIWSNEFNANINVLKERAIAAFHEKCSFLQAATNSPSIHSQNLNQSRGSKKASGLRISEIIDLTLDCNEGRVDIGVGNSSERASNSADYSIPHEVAQSTIITAPPQNIQSSDHSSINQYIGEKPVLDGSGSTGPELAIQYAETQMQTANSTLKAPFDTQPLCSAPQEISLQTTSGSETVPSFTKARKKGDPHRCNVCSKTFTRGTTLREHARSHTNEKPYKCSTCRKGFSRRKDCRRHELLHTNAKEFQCGGRFRDERYGCGRRFTRMDALKAHWNSLRGSECLKALIEHEKAELFKDHGPGGDIICYCGSKLESLDAFLKHLDVPFQSSCLRRVTMNLAVIFAMDDYDDHRKRTK